jgi:hypothetical protein
LEGLSANERLVEEARTRQSAWCERGLNGYGAN